jgi:hypothetical protein
MPTRRLMTSLQRLQRKADIHLLGSNGYLWPFPADWVMKSIRGYPTATCDPNRTFEEKFLRRPVWET